MISTSSQNKPLSPQAQESTHIVLAGRDELHSENVRINPTYHALGESKLSIKTCSAGQLTILTADVANFEARGVTSDSVLVEAKGCSSVSVKCDSRQKGGADQIEVYDSARVILTHAVSPIVKAQGERSIVVVGEIEDSFSIKALDGAKVIIFHAPNSSGAITITGDGFVSVGERILTRASLGDSNVFMYSPEKQS